MSDKQYYWPSLQPVLRQYVVRDDQDRHGIAHADNVYHKGVLFAHPIDVLSEIAPTPDMALPANAIVMTDTTWHSEMDGRHYSGYWYDSPIAPGQVPPDQIRHLTIVADLGYLMPDRFADEFLGGSDQMGHWDAYHAARLGSITSERKAAASRENGRRGGRPRKESKMYTADRLWDMFANQAGYIAVAGMSLEALTAQIAELRDEENDAVPMTNEDVAQKLHDHAYRCLAKQVASEIDTNMGSQNDELVSEIMHWLHHGEGLDANDDTVESIAQQWRDHVSD